MVIALPISFKCWAPTIILKNLRFFVVCCLFSFLAVGSHYVGQQCPLGMGGSHPTPPKRTLTLLTLQHTATLSHTALTLFCTLEANFLAVDGSDVHWILIDCGRVHSLIETAVHWISISSSAAHNPLSSGSKVQWSRVYCHHNLASGGLGGDDQECSNKGGSTSYINTSAQSGALLIHYFAQDLHWTNEYHIMWFTYMTSSGMYNNVFEFHGWLEGDPRSATASSNH